MANDFNILVGLKLDSISKMKSQLNSELKKVEGLKIKIDSVSITKKDIKSSVQDQLNNSGLKLKIENVDASKIKTNLQKQLSEMSFKINVSEVKLNTKNINQQIKNTKQQLENLTNIKGKSLNIGDGGKGFDELQRRANQIRNTVDSLAKINFITTANGGIEKAMITYTDKMGKIVTETMGWKKVMGETEGTVKNIFTTLGTSVSENVQKINQLKNTVANIKNNIQGQLNLASALGFDKNLIQNFQTTLNGFSTKTTVNEVQKLQDKINEALGTKTINNANKLQNAINSLNNRIANIKTSKAEIISNNNIEELRKAENEVQKLKGLLEQLKTGKIIDGKILASDINNARNSVNQLKTAINSININDNNIKKLNQLKETINTLKSQMQKRIDLANSLGFDSNVVQNFQNKLNSINTRTPIEQVKKLKTEIDNVIGSNSVNNVTKLQNAINTLTNRINNMKNTKMDIIKSNDIAELRTAQSEVQRLKVLLNEIKAGKVVNGKIIASEISTARNSVNQLRTAINSASASGATLANTFRQIATYVIGGSGVFFFLNQIKEGISTIKDLDTAMRDLKRVSDEVSETSLSKFPSIANEMAKSLGKSTEEVIQATTVWKQMGYEFGEASNFLAKNSMILSNVGDMSAQDSTNSLVSTLKAFRMEAKDTTLIVDTLNEVTNNLLLTASHIYKKYGKSLELKLEIPKAN